MSNYVSDTLICLQQQFDKIEMENLEFKIKISKLKATIAEQEKQLAEPKSGTDALLISYRNLVKYRDEYLNEILDLKLAIAEQDKKIHGPEGFKEKLAELTKELGIKNQRITSLEENIHQKGQAIALLNKKIDSIKEIIQYG